jgi:hypothetical protein
MHALVPLWEPCAARPPPDIGDVPSVLMFHCVATLEAYVMWGSMWLCCCHFGPKTVEIGELNNTNPWLMPVHVVQVYICSGASDGLLSFLPVHA